MGPDRASWQSGRTRSCVSACIGLILIFSASLPALATGTVTVCDQAHLDAALSGGGLVTFTCSGTIQISATKTIASDTTVDGSGQSVTIDGNHAVRVFTSIPAFI